MWQDESPSQIVLAIRRVRSFWAARRFRCLCRHTDESLQGGERCRKNSKSLRNRRQSEDPQGLKSGYTLSHRLAHALYSASVKRLPCGRTYPTQTSSILPVFLTHSTMGNSLWSPKGWLMETSWSTSIAMLVTTWNS